MGVAPRFTNPPNHRIAKIISCQMGMYACRRIEMNPYTMTVLLYHTLLLKSTCFKQASIEIIPKDLGVQADCNRYMSIHFHLILAQTFSSHSFPTTKSRCVSRPCVSMERINRLAAHVTPANLAPQAVAGSGILEVPWCS